MARGGRPGAVLSRWLGTVTQDWKETPSAIDTDPARTDGQRQAHSCGQAQGHGLSLYKHQPMRRGLGSCAGTGEWLTWKTGPKGKCQSLRDGRRRPGGKRDEKDLEPQLGKPSNTKK